MAVKSWFSLLRPRRFHKYPRQDDHKSEQPVEPPKNDVGKSTNNTQSTHSSGRLPAEEQEPVKTLSTNDYDSKHSVPNKSTTAVEPKVFWDRAYDSLKEDEGSLLEAYEKVLSSELSATSAASPVPEIDQNLIAQENTETRRAQMRELIGKGLAKTKHEANVKQGIGQVVDVVFAANELISTAIKQSPEASLAWTGVTFALQMIVNPIRETEANREGVKFVVSNMKWYWDLSRLVLQKRDPNGNSYAELRSGLEEQLVQLYKKLLAYQMKSVCSYYQNRGLVFLKDLVQLHSWSGQLTGINNIATTFNESITQYNMQQSLDFKQQNSKTLEEINKNIQALPSRQGGEKDKDDGCLRDLRITDPEDDMERIQTNKGKPLPESSKWILRHPYFNNWRHDETTRLLWVRADPGKGKTMLMINIIKELQAIPGSSPMSFFFCQATDASLNNATAVLRGLTCKLAEQHPFLMSHLRDKYDTAGKKLFEDSNAFVAVSKILLNMLCDTRLNQVYLAVDALDECQSGLKQLLDFINESLSDPSSRVKWIVSSRHNSDIVTKLSHDERKTELNLQKDVETEISHAVKAYIECNMRELIAKYEEKYTNTEILEELSSIESNVAEELYRKADNTFLWVALVFQQIDPNKCEVDKVFEFVRKMPVGLHEMYNRMMEQIIQQQGNYSDYCKKVLLVAVNSYRPLRSSEMKTLADLSKYVVLRDVIQLCGILSFREEDEVIYFVHQSAKDYLIHHAKPEIISQIFANGCMDGHRQILSQSLKSMSNTLKRDVYDLSLPGFCAADVHPPSPDPLAKIRYACMYWVDHLHEMGASNYENFLHDNKDVDKFLRKHLLHWLEALSLMKNIPSGMLSITKLTNLVKSVSRESNLFELACDIYRFTLFNGGVIENNPLQVYHSALVFSPTNSLTRRLFRDDEPSWLTVKTGTDSTWGACLQTLEDHDSVVTTVRFSPDNAYIASGSWDETIRIWDASNRTCLQILEGHDGWINSIAFSPDSACIVSGACDRTIRTWDTRNGDCTKIIQCDNYSAHSVAFSPNGAYIASGCSDGAIRFWNASNGDCLQTISAHDNWVTAVTFSPDGASIVSSSEGSNEGPIKIWNASNGGCLYTLKGHNSLVKSVALSRDGLYIAAGSSDGTIRIWDSENRVCLQTLKYETPVKSVAFSPCGAYIVSGYDNSKVLIWCASNGTCLQTLEGHTSTMSSVKFSPDGSHIASGSWDQTVKIWEWDARNIPCLEASEHHGDQVSSVVFSSDHTKFASGAWDKTVKIWDASNGICLRTLKGHGRAISSAVSPPDGSGRPMGYSEDFATRTVDFSPDGAYVVSAATDKAARLWDVNTGACLQTLGDHVQGFNSVAFSPDGIHVASAFGKSANIWDARNGACLHKLELDEHVRLQSSIRSVVFSHDGAYLASGYSDMAVRIWDVRNGDCLETIRDQGMFVRIDTATSRFCTEAGILPWQYNTQNDTYTNGMPLHPTYELNADGTWVTCNGKNVLWIPPDYRRSCPAMSRGTVMVIGTKIGRVLVFNFAHRALL